MIAKSKPPLRLVKPQFAIAAKVKKVSADDEFVILSRSEFDALVRAAIRNET